LDDENREDAGILVAINFTQARPRNPLISQSGCIGLVGASSSTVSKIEAQVCRIYTLPQISYASTNIQLSDKVIYPYFARTVPPDSSQASAIIQLCLIYGWREIGLLSSDSLYASGIASELESQASLQGVLVSVTRDYREGDILGVSTALTAIAVSGVKVIVYASGNSNDDFVNTMTLATEKGLTGPGYAWIVSDALAQTSAFEDNEMLITALEGLIGVTPGSGAGPLWEDFVSRRWPALAPAYSGGLTSINTYAPYSYDAVFTFAHAIKNVLDAGLPLTPPQLNSAIPNVTFLGLTGNVTFDSVGDRIGSAVQVMNFVGGNFVARGSCTLGLGCDVKPGDLIFLGPTNTTPSTVRPVANSSDESNLPPDDNALSTAVIVILVILGLVLIVVVVLLVLIFKCGLCAERLQRDREPPEPDYSRFIFNSDFLETLNSQSTMYHTLKFSYSQKRLVSWQKAIMEHAPVLAICMLPLGAPTQQLGQDIVLILEGAVPGASAEVIAWLIEANLFDVKKLSQGDGTWCFLFSPCLLLFFACLA
jgi:ABC-type branched-subunit amino acid transport system substrate-binding protein